MKAVIQAGGAGTRLATLTKDLPKPMVDIGGKPILEWQLESLKRSGILEAMIIVSKRSHAIQDYFGDGSKLGMQISYFVEDEPLGTGGAFAYIAKQIQDDFIFLLGDLMLDISWDRMVEFHKKKGGMITAFVHPNSHPEDSDILILDAEGLVKTILPKKEPRDFFYQNLVLAGAYVISSELLETFEDIDEPFKMDFEKEILIPTIACEGVYGYVCSEYIKDCGTPSRYYAVIRDLQQGVIAAKNLKNPQKAIFLDRDGVINVFGDYVTDASKLRIGDRVAQAIKMINESGYLAIVVTNQPVVARGDTTLAELHNIHMKMETLLGQEGAYLDAIYFCPHHPHKGFPGERVEFKIDCECRKPKIGMLLQAKERFNIDLSASWFVGDTYRDIQTGINGGCHTVHLTSGDPNYAQGFASAKPEYVCKDLYDAVTLILAKKSD